MVNWNAPTIDLGSAAGPVGYHRLRLLLTGTHDHYVPAHQLHRQAAALTSARSVTTRLFTRAEQAHNHCQIGNLDVCLRTVLAWVESLQAPGENPG